ncbi:DUF4238 domain-containing protein, partial [Mameliella sp. CS4]|uniref:DUF4238 domain-containing protein n=1 Tax=Mameliella sp. CS4 TaxID=2862329 RepID=UPI001C5F976A
MLRNFCFESNAVYYVEKAHPGREPKRRNISSIFCRRHYHSVLKQKTHYDTDLEAFFANNLEAYIPEWTSIFKRAVSSGRIEFGSEDLQTWFIQFFYNHMKRSPDFLDPIAKSSMSEVFHPEVIEEVERNFRPLSQKEKERILSPEFQDETLWNSRVVNISKQGMEVLEIIAEMDLVVATSARQKDFIVASNPVARFERYRNQRLGEIGVEMWTTFSASIAVGFVAKGAGTGTLFLGSGLVLTQSQKMTVAASAIAEKKV